MSCKTSDERREVASKLRQMANAYDATEASRVAHALGLEYKVYGTVVAFDSADIRNLADLIDPTCKVDSADSTAGLTAYRLSCGHTSFRPAYTQWPPPVCPDCGARVVSDDDQ